MKFFLLAVFLLVVVAANQEQAVEEEKHEKTEEADLSDESIVPAAGEEEIPIEEFFPDQASSEYDIPETVDDDLAVDPTSLEEEEGGDDLEEAMLTMEPPIENEMTSEDE